MRIQFLIELLSTHILLMGCAKLMDVPRRKEIAVPVCQMQVGLWLAMVCACTSNSATVDSRAARSSQAAGSASLMASVRPLRSTADRVHCTRSHTQTLEASRGAQGVTCASFCPSLLIPHTRFLQEKGNPLCWLCSSCSFASLCLLVSFPAL